MKEIVYKIYKWYNIFIIIYERRNSMKIGFIGCGNMATAIIGGLVNSKVFKPQEIIASNRSRGKLDEIVETYGINTSLDNKEVARRSEIIVLSVKPQFYLGVMEEIRGVIDGEKIIITIAPGFSLEKLESLLGDDVKIVRTMPNTPAMVGEGMTAMCLNKNITKEEGNKIKEILSSFGRAEIVPEYMMDAVVAVSGSSPAYVFLLIEAMADAAVLGGMSRDQAYTFAAQAVYGSAKMVLDTKTHPGELKDMVCSPAGTTIEAVKVLEEKGFRSSIIEAMIACSEKSKNM